MTNTLELDAPALRILIEERAKQLGELLGRADHVEDTRTLAHLEDAAREAVEAIDIALNGRSA